MNINQKNIIMENNHLKADMKLIDEGLKFQTKAGDRPEIITDYIPRLGHNEGYMPLELFLISFGTCVSGVVLPLLRKMQKDIEAYSIHAEGIRETEHPTGFSKIILDIIVKSKNTTTEDVEKVVKMAEDKYCPIWSMLNKDIEIETNITIHQ
ncbi:MAG: OsmC family protein [Bacteroidales bacterium]|jgi:putative redox protein|nr:OsmC family protein [Bacteroidales bacterium]